MTDVALNWDPVQQRADFALTPFDLVTDDGLLTAAIVSLASDRRADADDVLPSPDADPRGYWGDIPADSAVPDPVGSKFWLRRRARLTPALLRTLEQDAVDPLQWMIIDGVAASVTAVATPQNPPLGTVRVVVTILRKTANASAARSFDLTWTVTVGSPT